MGETHISGTGGMPLPEKTRRRRMRRLFRLLATTLLVVIVLGFIVRVPRVVWSTGNVMSEEYAEVRPAVVGTVKEIKAHSGDQVNKGDLLILLDDTEAESTMEEARRQAHKAAAELGRMEADIAEQKRRLNVEISVTELRLKNALSRLTRTGELLERGLVAGSVMEDEQLKGDLIRAELDSLKSRDLTIYEKQLAVAREELAVRRETVTRTEAALRAREIRAPISGQVLRYEFVPGELVRPDMVLLEIFGGERQLLKLRVPERYATHVAVGNHCRARLTSYSGLGYIWFEGQVRHLRNAIQYDGKTGYRVAYCSFDDQSKKIPPGATAEAKLYCGRTCLWMFLLGLH